MSIRLTKFHEEYKTIGNVSFYTVRYFKNWKKEKI